MPPAASTLEGIAPFRNARFVVQFFFGSLPHLADLPRRRPARAARTASELFLIFSTPHHRDPAHPPWAKDHSGPLALRPRISPLAAIGAVNFLHSPPLVYLVDGIDGRRNRRDRPSFCILTTDR